MYRSSDIFLFLSYHEGLGNTVLEAMASRVPVIATDVDELSYMLDQGRGILVPPGDVDEAVSAIYKMLSDDEFRVDCVQRAYEYAMKEHSFDYVRDKTLRFLESVTN